MLINFIKIGFHMIPEADALDFFKEELTEGRLPTVLVDEDMDYYGLPRKHPFYTRLEYLGRYAIALYPEYEELYKELQSIDIGETQYYEIIDDLKQEDAILITGFIYQREQEKVRSELLRHSSEQLPGY